jgi:hypothetical protein
VKEWKASAKEDKNTSKQQLKKKKKGTLHLHRLLYVAVAVFKPTATKWTGVCLRVSRERTKKKREAYVISCVEV